MKLISNEANVGVNEIGPSRPGRSFTRGFSWEMVIGREMVGNSRITVDEVNEGLSVDYGDI